mgnify:FL=1
MTMTVVLDFDGVVTRHGEFAKELAWDKLAADALEPEEQKIQEKFMAILKQKRELYGQGKAKGDRYDILRDSLKELGCSKEKLELKVILYASRYNDLVQQLVLAGGLSEGAEKALEELCTVASLYINSATPEDAVQQSVKTLGIDKYFKAVFGRPRTKQENLYVVAGLEKISAQELLFVGDGSGDEKAAQDVGCMFVGFSNAWNKWENKSFPLIHDLGELIPHCKRGYK